MPLIGAEDATILIVIPMVSTLNDVEKEAKKTSPFVRCRFFRGTAECPSNATDEASLASTLSNCEEEFSMVTVLVRMYSSVMGALLVLGLLYRWFQVLEGFLEKDICRFLANANAGAGADVANKIYNSMLLSRSDIHSVYDESPIVEAMQ